MILTNPQDFEMSEKPFGIRRNFIATFDLKKNIN